MTEQLERVRLAAIKPGQTVRARSIAGFDFGWAKVLERNLTEDRERIVLELEGKITWYIHRDYWNDHTELLA